MNDFSLPSVPPARWDTGKRGECVCDCIIAARNCLSWLVVVGNAHGHHACEWEREMKNIPISGNSQGIRSSITVRLTEELSGSQGAGSIYRQAAFNRPALQPVNGDKVRTL